MGYFFSLLLLSKSATETLLDVSEVLLIACGFVLAFGCIGEYLEEHQRLPRWMRWPKLVFITMVVTSLIGEFFSDAGVFLFSRPLQTISESKFAALNIEAGNAIERASKADERASKNEKEAEGERLARVKIERLLGPRSLSQEQQNRIADRLRHFAGMSVFILAYANETKAERDEAIEFAISIWAMLKRAGIKSEAAWSSEPWGIQGLWITGGGGETQNPRASDLWSAIIKAMTDEKVGISQLIPPDLPAGIVFVLPETAATGIAPVDIRIIVGKRPQIILRR